MKVNNMKILAVIPARAGSKGIPNKNIRLLSGKPLIYYCIHNALLSRNITDIVISTDSPEIAVIAEQMGVQCVWRREELCGDLVTLDSVIYDVAREIECDYAITMQPTSPTLKVETLDKAIDYCILQQLDTLISVTNRPHLSWRREGESIIQNYKKRLNRQELPDNYLETGAFLISRKEIITYNSRIGNKIGVYEIDGSEAIDIDSFADFRNAEYIIDNKSVAIYVNGNNKRGMGHIYRALELADEFYIKPEIYYDTNQTDLSVFGNTTHKLQPVDGIGELFEILKDKQYKYFINDILGTTIDYMIALRKILPTAKIINFEDDGEGSHKADLVFNALFQKTNCSHIKTGEQYYISPRLFMFYDPIVIKEKVESVFISFGGADPQNYTDRLIKIISEKKYKHIKFIIVIGRAKENIDNLLQQKTDNILIYYDISNMPSLMSKCDIGITSRGRTGFELALLGIPSIAMAQNQREEKHGFVNNENGFMYLGLNPSNSIIKANLDVYIDSTYQERKSLQNTLLAHDLRHGRKKVMGYINNL